MKLGLLIGSLVSLGQCLDLSVVPSLKKLDSLIGVHTVSTISNTPPSTSNVTFYLSVYDKIPIVIENENCPKDSSLCIVTEISLPSGETIVTEVKSMSSIADKGAKINRYLTGESLITLEFPNWPWGEVMINTVINVECDRYLLDETMEAFLNFNALNIRLFSNQSCTKVKDDSSSWGWFTWLFIFMVIIFAGYVIGNAWINANSTGNNEFLNALLDSIVDILNRLPAFLKEIWTKIVGNRGREEYSAI